MSLTSIIDLFLNHFWIFTLGGFVVGAIVGITGVGGGSLMTPFLIALGIPPIKAVGSDLIYASLTKASAIWVHQKKKTIDWKIVTLLSIGSLPAALLTIAVMHSYGFEKAGAGTDAIIKGVLAGALVLTALAIFFKSTLINIGKIHDHDSLHIAPKKLATATIATGFLLGVLVTISSIGAGAVGTVALFFLYPLISTNRIVGTDIAHAVPLTAVAGLSHAHMGTVDWTMLTFLLAGSLPGIYIGSHIGGSIPDKYLRPALATMLLIIAFMMVQPLLK